MWIEYLQEGCVNKPRILRVALGSDQNLTVWSLQKEIQDSWLTLAKCDLKARDQQEQDLHVLTVTRE